ncbi:MAG TPA: DUF4118 domain-containing protein [Candidatus Dormibacteraeota bacterium]|nr:DUF4118 domain-containing protein [Candidatus Dormibacteraeota bacterium]
MTGPNRRLARGLAAALAVTVVLVGLMLPARAQLGYATSGLVLIIPVVVGVAIGGWQAGLAAIGAGFLSYDYFFIRPYGTLVVSSYRDWITLAVYLVVMVIVARVVIDLQRARVQARRREDGARHLLEVTELLIGDRPPEELLQTVVRTVQHEFRLSSVALLLPVLDQLVIAAQSGPALPEEAIRGGTLAGRSSTALAQAGLEGLRTMPLATAERGIGVLLLDGPALSATDQQLLTAYANQAALAVERAQLREQLLQGRVLSEVDGWRRALLASVAHDLRTPLASIKASLSDLGDDSVPLSTSDRQDLLTTAEGETDRLSRLVTNLLDMYRIEAGMRRLLTAPAALIDLVEEAVEALGGLLGSRPVGVDVAASLRVMVDRTLVVRVLVNLLENANLHTPEKAPVAVRARRQDTWVELEVEDRGPGLSPERLATLFSPAPDGPGPAGSATGVGLVICKAFIEANGGRISARAGSAGGLLLDILLPAA